MQTSRTSGQYRPPPLLQGPVSHQPYPRFEMSERGSLSGWPEPVPEPAPLPDTGGSTRADNALVKAEVLKNGVAADLVPKVHEGRPNIVDRMINGEVALAINTPFGKSAFVDDTYIRRTAPERRAMRKKPRFVESRKSSDAGSMSSALTNGGFCEKSTSLSERVNEKVSACAAAGS